VRSYADKAQEYADAAESEIDAGRYIAATSLAIHAAINAADAICGARLGARLGARATTTHKYSPCFAKRGRTESRSRQTSDACCR